MKIRRFVGKDNRHAMRQVKEALGSEAVILSTRRVDGGIEILTADDYDESLLSRHNQLINNKTDTNQTSQNPPTFSRQAKSVESSPATIEESPEVKAPETERHEQEIGQMRQELQNLRGLLENQLSGLAWNDLNVRKPMEADLLKRFLLLGLEAKFSKHMAAQVINMLPAGAKFDEIWAEALDKLAALIPVLGCDYINDNASAVALVGPTGAGKTTSLIKLATQYVVKHGGDSLGLISFDNRRIGAVEQMRAYARILGTHARLVNDYEGAQEAIDAFYDKKLILIDTPGIHDWKQPEAQELLRLKKTLDVDIFLTLSATTQYSVMDSVVSAFKSEYLKGIILTKLDESVSLGESISVLVKNDIPLGYVADGQNIPDDLRVGLATQLVSAAVRVAQGQKLAFSNELLAMKIGGVSAND